MHRGAGTKACVIAVCGKGGVGKTSVSAMIVKILSVDHKNRVLAVDADPAAGLAAALGVTVAKTVDDIRCDLIRKVEKGGAGGKEEMLAMLDYEMFSALCEHETIAFLAIGRPETEGCYCQVNQILKDLIRSMADNFDYVVIDGEAGIEQVNRRVMERVSHLILVSDPSARGINVAKTIRQVSDSAISYQQAGLILNRIRNDEELSRVSIPDGIGRLGWIPEDETIRSADIEGRSILDMGDAPAVRAVAACLKSMGVLQEMHETYAGHRG